MKKHKIISAFLVTAMLFGCGSAATENNTSDNDRQTQSGVTDENTENTSDTVDAAEETPKEYIPLDAVIEASENTNNIYYENIARLSGGTIVARYNMNNFGYGDMDVFNSYARSYPQKIKKHLNSDCFIALKDGALYYGNDLIYNEKPIKDFSGEAFLAEDGTVMVLSQPSQNAKNLRLKEIPGIEDVTLIKSDGYYNEESTILRLACVNSKGELHKYIVNGNENWTEPEATEIGESTDGWENAVSLYITPYSTNSFDVTGLRTNGSLYNGQGVLREGLMGYAESLSVKAYLNLDGTVELESSQYLDSRVTDSISTIQNANAIYIFDSESTMITILTSDNKMYVVSDLNTVYQYTETGYCTVGSSGQLGEEKSLKYVFYP